MLMESILIMWLSFCMEYDLVKKPRRGIRWNSSKLVAVVEFGNRADGESLVATALEDADQGVVSNDGHGTLVDRSCDP